MAKPSTTVTWATDTNFASGPESGTPTKVDPSSGFKAQGWIPGAAAIAQYMNHVLNVIGQWITYLNLSGTDEITYANTRTRTILVPFSKGTMQDNTAGDWFVPGVGGGLTLKSPGGAPAVWVMPIELPHGSVLKSVTVSCLPDATAATGVLALSVERSVINRGTFTNTVTTLGSDSASGVGAAAQDLATGTLTVTIDRENASYYATLTSSTHLGASDQFRHFEVVYEETRATGSN